MIRLRVTTTDGYKATESFKTLTGARAFVRHQLGCFDMGSFYLVGEFGDCKITVVEGCTLDDLARAEKAAKPAVRMDVTDRFRVYVSVPRFGDRDEITGSSSQLIGTADTWAGITAISSKIVPDETGMESVRIFEVLTVYSSDKKSCWTREEERYGDPDAVAAPVIIADDEIPF